MTKALLIVDMLNDFVQNDETYHGKLAVPGAEDIVPNIVLLRENAYRRGKLVLYANDSHAQDDPEFEDWPSHCVAGTYGAEVVAKLAPRNGDVILEKQTLSIFGNPEANQTLRTLGVEEIDVVGVATEYCDLANTVDALQRGYRVNVLVDAIAGVDIRKGDQFRALMEMGKVGARPMYTAQILDDVVEE